MINLSCSAAAMAASAVVRAAQLLLSDLEHGRRIDAAGTLRAAMETAFGASDASGAWHWKAAYDACEAATVLFLRKYASSIRRNLNIQPTLTIRPGFDVRVMVNRDLILEPYRG